MHRDNALQAELAAIRTRLAEIQRQLLTTQGVDLNVEVHSLGDGSEVVISGDTTGLVHIALWALDCAKSDVAGKHAHIDEAGIANVGSTPLVIARAGAKL